jgi:uncharacterized coiled-coil DUF342 family protein
MPFTKQNKKDESRQDSLAQALGFSDKRADEILDGVHDLLHEAGNHHDALKALYEKYNDNELLFAAYAYGRMVEGHETKVEKLLGEASDEIKEFLEGFSKFMSERK